jgi:hypothetical protein
MATSTLFSVPYSNPVIVSISLIIGVKISRLARNAGIAVANKPNQIHLKN